MYVAEPRIRIAVREVSASPGGREICASWVCARLYVLIRDAKTRRAPPLAAQ